MAFSLYKIIKGLLIKEENTNTPKEIEIIPGGTASTKTTITSSQTTNKTITLPDATDTLVGKATTDTLTNKTFDADGTGNVLSNIDDGNIKALAGIDATKIADGSVTSTEFQYIGGLTSDAQTQINSKADSSTLTAHTGASSGVHGVTGSVVGTSDTQSLTNKTINADLNTLSNIDNADIKVGAAIDAAKIHDGSVSNVEFGYLDGVTSGIQTQLNAKATLTGTETFQNKTLDNTNTITVLDSNLTIQDNSDNTKQLKFEASSIATGTTRTLTVPNANTTIVGTDATQTLSNKTFSDAPILSEIATPSTPSSGFGKVYFKSDGFLYQLNDSGIESKVGGSGGGTKNYLTDIVTTGSASPNPGNGNLELGTTTGWSLFNTTLTNKIPTGSITAGASSLTFGVTSTAPNVLAGTYSLNVTASSSWSAGQGVISDAFYIDQEDYAKVLSFKIAYKNFFSAGNANFSGTSDNTLAVYIYDVTNSQWIQPSGVYGITQSSGVGYVSGSFQTSSNGTQYRIAVLAANASSGSGGMYMDDFTIGPNSLVYGAPVSDWLDYTAGLTAVIGTIDNNAITARSRRVGGNLEVVGSIGFTGTPSAFNVVGIGIPSGLVIDLTRLSSSNNETSIVGEWTATDVAVNNYGLFRIAGYQSSLPANYVLINAFTNTSPFSFSTGDKMDFKFSVPIVGWSSNVQMSNDTDTRVVAFKAKMNSQPPAPTTVATNIIFNVVDSDTHGAYNASTGVYTIPVTGYYDISGSLSFSASTQPAGVIWISIINGVRNFYLEVPVSSNGIPYNVPVSAKGVKLNAGTQISIQGAYNTALATPITPIYNSLFADWSTLFFEVIRVSGPSVIAASETIAARYQHSSGQTISNAASEIVNFADKIIDTHNAVTTGASWKFTAPASGIYNISGLIVYGSASFSTNSQIRLDLFKNGIVTQRLGFFRTEAASGADLPSAQGSSLIKLNAGDYIHLEAYQDNGGPRSLQADGTFNWINVHRIGL